MFYFLNKWLHTEAEHSFFLKPVSVESIILIRICPPIEDL